MTQRMTKSNRKYGEHTGIIQVPNCRPKNIWPDPWLRVIRPCFHNLVLVTVSSSTETTESRGMYAARTQRDVDWTHDSKTFDVASGAAP
jgi:hypothetical protein